MSSAVNLPITSAILRLVVVWMGVRSIRCTNSGTRLPPRFNFTTNFVFFIVCHSFCPSRETVCEQPVVHFSRIGVTLTPVRDLPHSKQHAFDRDVINPQDGHILCDPYPAMRGVSLCILCSSRIANSTISRPKEKLVAFMKPTLLGESCRNGIRQTTHLLKKPRDSLNK